MEKFFNLRVPVELYNKVEQLASLRKMKLTTLIREIIQQHVDSNPLQIMSDFTVDTHITNGTGVASICIELHNKLDMQYGGAPIPFIIPPSVIPLVEHRRHSFDEDGKLIQQGLFSSDGKFRGLIPEDQVDTLVAKLKTSLDLQIQNARDFARKMNFEHINRTC